MKKEYHDYELEEDFACCVGGRDYKAASKAADWNWHHRMRKRKKQEQ